jgi:hypothetical protein
MSIHGIIFIDLVALSIIGLIVNLVRTRKLNVGYAVIWLLALSGVIALVSFSPLLEFITHSVGAIYPASAVSLLAFVFIFLVLIFFSIQLSKLLFQQNELIQYLALKELLEKEKQATRQDIKEAFEIHELVKEPKE